MGFLKVISLKPPFGLPKILRTATFSTKANNIELDTVNMSFTSYENNPASTGTPPLVVMHGLFGSKRNWNSLCKAFHQKTVPPRRIIAVDARNHGDSPHCSAHSYPHLAEDIKLFLAQLNVEKAALLGHSMGGRAMMYFALRYPELVDKLIVGDISPIGNSPNLTSMSSIFAAVNEVSLPRAGPVAAARLTCDLQLSKNITDQGLRAFLLTNLAREPDGSYAWRVNVSALLANFTNNIAYFPDVGNLTFNGPVLFVAGGASDFIRKADHPHILKLFPNAEFREIGGAGHWVHSDKPNDFLQVCTEFLNRKVQQS